MQAVARNNYALPMSFDVLFVVYDTQATLGLWNHSTGNWHAACSSTEEDRLQVQTQPGIRKSDPLCSFN